MGETRYNKYEGIKIINSRIPRFVHELDQFVWYRDVKEKVLKADDDSNSIEQLLSAVRFILPYHHTSSPTYLMIAGDGLSICNLYFIRIRTEDLLTGVIPPQASGCWELFSYLDNASYRRGWSNPEVREVERSLPSRFNQIFTTDIGPFLKGLDYPTECDRVYEIHPSCISFDRIRVIAENREDRKKQRLRIFWIPDKRVRNPREIMTLRNMEWETRQDFVPSSRIGQFTFSDTANALNR